MTRAFGVGGEATPSSDLDPEPGLVRRTVTGVAWIASLVAIIVLLDALGRGQLSTPPLMDRSELRIWLDERDAVIAAFALMRLVGLGLALYLLAVTVLGLAARLSRVPGLVRLADAATLPMVRRILGAVAGIGLTASAASLMAAELLPGQGSGPPVVAEDAGIVLQRLPDSEDVILRRIADVPESSSTLRVEDPTEQTDDTNSWTSEAGDHLWQIAEDTLAEAWQRPATDAEVTPYWQALIDANRHVLVDAENPDLIYPGQTFALPAPPAPPPPPAP